jgi:hypothetical protein
MKACLRGRNWKRLGVTPRGNTQMVNFFQLFRTWTWQVAFSVSAQFPKWRKPKANSSPFWVILSFLLNGITLRTYSLSLSSVACYKYVPLYFSFCTFFISLAVFFVFLFSRPLISHVFSRPVYVSQPEWPQPLSVAVQYRFAVSSARVSSLAFCFHVARSSGRLSGSVMSSNMLFQITWGQFVRSGNSTSNSHH